MKFIASLLVTTLGVCIGSLMFDWTSKELLTALIFNFNGFACAWILK